MIWNQRTVIDESLGDSSGEIMQIQCLWNFSFICTRAANRFQWSIDFCDVGLWDPGMYWFSSIGGPKIDEKSGNVFQILS